MGQRRDQTQIVERGGPQLRHDQLEVAVELPRGSLQESKLSAMFRPRADLTSERGQFDDERAQMLAELISIKR